MAELTALWNEPSTVLLALVGFRKKRQAVAAAVGGPARPKCSRSDNRRRERDCLREPGRCLLSTNRTDPTISVARSCNAAIAAT